MLKALLQAFRRYVYRSSVTGKYVSKAFAEKNPDTTTRERV